MHQVNTQIQNKLSHGPRCTWSPSPRLNIITNPILLVYVVAFVVQGRFSQFLSKTNDQIREFYQNLRSYQHNHMVEPPRANVCTCTYTCVVANRPIGTTRIYFEWVCQCMPHRKPELKFSFSALSPRTWCTIRIKNEMMDSDRESAGFSGAKGYSSHAYRGYH